MTLAYVELARWGGWTALVLLCAALCASPAGRAASHLRPALAHRVPRVRRALGISAACAALGHALFAFAGVGVSLELAWSWPHLRMGVLALFALCLLLATSFPALVRALRLAAWKELHRLAYAALVLALLHALLAPFASRRALATIFACTLLFGTLRALRARAPQH